MKNLLIKDITFNKKSFPFIILFCLFIPLSILFEGRGGETVMVIFLTFFLPFIITNMLVSRISSVEDNVNTRNFLKTLPYSTGKRVAARYIFMFLSLIIGIVYSMIINIFLFHQYLSYIIPVSLIILCLLLIYYSLYLTLYFYYSFYAAQFCVWIILAVMAAISYFTKSTSISIIGFSKSPLLYLLTIIALIISFFVSCKGENNDKRHVSKTPFSLHGRIFNRY